VGAKGWPVGHATPWPVREVAWRAWSAGASGEQAAAAAGVAPAAFYQWVRDCGGVRPRAPRPRAALRLSAAEREDISRGLAAGSSYAAIARGIARPTSTVSREVARNGGRRRYRATRAEGHAFIRARRPKPAKLATHTRLRGYVETGLQQHWSPQQIAARLVLDHPDDETMRVSHETIYTSLFVQARGALRKELTTCLRTGRTMRRPHRPRTEGRHFIDDKVMISARPAEAADRAVPGHWEGDLILGKASKSAVGTLVERSTRFTMLLHLPGGQHAEGVAAAITAKIGELPQQLRRSLTWDQGKEMAGHVAIKAATGMQVYFCDPHSPWQRGSNENTNGLLRQYLPKGTDLSVHAPADLDRIAAELNARPRQTLGWKTPSEALTELLP